MADKKLYLECECHSPEHLGTFALWDWGPKERPEIYACLQASHYLPWYLRIWPAVKYVFSGWGISWSDVHLQPKDVDQLLEMLEEYKQLNAVYEEGKKNG